MEIKELVTRIYDTLVHNIDKLDKVAIISHNEEDMITIKQTNNKTIRIKFEEETNNEML